MGSLGISLSMHQVDNIANSANNDREGYQLGLSFAFLFVKFDFIKKASRCGPFFYLNN